MPARAFPARSSGISRAGCVLRGGRPRPQTARRPARGDQRHGHACLPAGHHRVRRDGHARSVVLTRPRRGDDASGRHAWIGQATVANASLKSIQRRGEVAERTGSSPHTNQRPPQEVAGVAGELPPQVGARPKEKPPAHGRGATIQKSCRYAGTAGARRGCVRRSRGYPLLERAQLGLERRQALGRDVVGTDSPARA